MKIVALLAAVLCCVALLSPSRAEACGNSMREERGRSGALVADKHEQALREATVASAKGNHRRALTKAMLAMTSPQSHIQKKARRVVGLSSLALGNFAAASTHLEVSAREHDNAPVLVAKLAEAEVGLGHPDRALELLEPLAKDELIPDADGFVALARARWAKQNKEGALAAVEQALQRNAKHQGALKLKSELEGKAPVTPVPPLSTRLKARS